MGRLPHEDKDFCKSSNTTLNDLSNDTLNDVYLGIDINSKYPQVLSLLDSLAQDGLVKSVEKVNRPYLGYYTRLILNIGSINIDKSITFKSILSLLKRGEYETIETSCEIFFFDNKLYAIEVYPIGGDSAQISNLYVEKYGKPNIPVKRSYLSPINQDITLYDYSGDPYFSYINMKYHTITDWRFSNAVISLIVQHENKHTIHFDDENWDYVRKRVKPDYINNDKYTESEMLKVLKYCSIKQVRDYEYTFESIFYINDNVQKLINEQIARERKLYNDSIEQARMKEQLDEKRKAKEAETRFKHQRI